MDDRAKSAYHEAIAAIEQGGDVIIAPHHLETLVDVAKGNPVSSAEADSAVEVAENVLKNRERRLSGRS